MDFREYQEKSRRTARYPVIGHGVIYPTLGLANEAGEVTLLIEAPWMQDAKGRISYSVAVRVLHSSGGFLYEVLPDQKWLSEAAYPVKIDPTVSYNPSWTGTVDSALPNQQFVPGLPTDHDGMCLAVGGQPTHELRSVLHFGATLPLDADIDSAILSMDLRINEKASPLEIQAHALPTALSPGGSPYPSPTWNNVGASVPGGPASAPVVVNAVATYYWDVFDIVRSWDESRDDNAPVELNILMRATTSWYNTVLFATQDKAPKITVTYSEGWTTLQGNRRRQGRTQYAISSSPTERWDTALTDGPSQPVPASSVTCVPSTMIESRW